MESGLYTIRVIVFLAVIVGTTVSSWIVAVRMRRRVRKSLGKRASDLDLVSFKMWNEVEKAEQQKAESGPIHPR